MLNFEHVVIATLVKLQQKVNGPKKNDFSADSRKLLASIDVDGQKLGEGMAVRIAGFMLDDPSPNKGVHANKGESVNCNLKGVDNNDFHVPLLAHPGDSECSGVVAEMIPQARPDSWSSKALRKTAYVGDDLQFIVLLPDEINGLRALESKLTADVLAGCTKLEAQDVDLHLPKFKLEPPTIALAKAEAAWCHR